MLILLLIAIAFLIAAIASAVREHWRSVSIQLAAFVLFIGLGLYLLMSWNAVMLKVYHDSTTRAAR